MNKLIDWKRQIKHKKKTCFYTNQSIFFVSQVSPKLIVLHCIAKLKLNLIFCHASHAVAAHQNKMLRRLAELILFVRGPLQGWHGSAIRRYRIQTV